MRTREAVEHTCTNCTAVFHAQRAGLCGVCRAEDVAARAATVNPRRLTNRQTQLRNLMAQGLTNKEIAWRLRLSTGTVKVYSNGLFRKLGVQSRSEVMAAVLHERIAELEAELAAANERLAKYEGTKAA